jgi:O-antigen ligase
MNLKLPIMAYCFVGFIVLLAVQWALGMVSYPQHALIAMLYLLFAVGVCTLGALIVERMGIEAVVVTLAWFTLIGATLCALVGLWQLIGPPTSLTMPLLGPRIYGNTGQPNHFADYVFLGLASLVYITMRDERTWQVDLRTAVFTFVLAPALALSGSMSAWVYFVLLIGFLLWRNCWEGLKVAMFALAIFGGTAVAALQTAHGTGVTLHAAATGQATRLRMWSESLRMLHDHPWLGVGFRQFGYEHFSTGYVGGDPWIADNAHNLLLNVGAEFGAIGLLVLLVPLGWWAWTAFLRKEKYLWKGYTGALNSMQERRPIITPERWWCLMLLAVIGFHSMVEYPLNYAYFLGIASFLFGATNVVDSSRIFHRTCA